jgi:hypothetical protein
MSGSDQGDARTNAWLDASRKFLASGRVTKSPVATIIAAGLMVLACVACVSSSALADVDMSGRLEKAQSPITTGLGEVKPLATSVSGDYRCADPYSVIGNRPFYFAIGNCAEGWDIEAVAYSGENSVTHEHSYGGYIGSAYSYCGWIDTRFPVEKLNNNSNSACKNGSNNATELEESSFMEKYDQSNANHDGNWIVNKVPCPEYANYRPWSENNAPKELIRTVPAYEAGGEHIVEHEPALKWRYVTKYASVGEPKVKYVMVRDDRIKGGGEGNWVFVPLSCLRSTPAELPENGNERLPPPPTVTTDAASGVATPTATLNATVNPNGVATKYLFEYGTSTSYGSETHVGEAGAGTSNVPVNATVAGLAPDTTYYFRIVASSAIGEVFGSPVAFTTQPKPTVTTSAATGVVDTQVTLNGALNPNGLDTHYYFEYGLATSGYEHDVPAIPGADAGSGTGSVPVSATVTGLTKHTTYHYRLVASSNAGTNEGGSEGFATYDTFVGQPSAVAQTNGTIDVFGRLADNELGHDWYINGQWNGAENVAASMASEPSAVQSNSGVLDVFWQGTDNNLWHVWYTPGVGWNGPQNLGMGPLGGAPHAVGQSNGDVDVFWKGTSSSNYGLYHASYSPSAGWSGPESVGGAPLGSEPAPVVTEPGLLDVYWEGESKSNYGLYHMWYTPSTKTWNGPQALGGAPLGSPPAPASPMDGNVSVFWAGTTSSLWSDWYTVSSGSWSGPLNVGG